MDEPPGGVKFAASAFTLIRRHCPEFRLALEKLTTVGFSLADVATPTSTT